MKVCFLNHNMNAATGAGRFGSNVVLRLLRSQPGMEAFVLTTIPSGHPLERPIVPANWLLLFFRLPRIRAEFRRADIVHALDGYPFGVIAAIALIGLRRPLVITAIGTGAVQPLYRWHGWILAWAYRRARRIFAISAYTRREILKKVPDIEITVIHHAVDAAEFGGDLMAALTGEERAAITAMQPYVLSVGGWKKRKGFEYSFAAFAELRKRFPNMRYVLCGIGPKPKLEQPLGLEGSVRYFKGIRWPFLKAIYANAELFWLLAVDDDKDIEGFGFVFLEAAAAGLPVIGTEGTGAEDALQNGENGFLVPQRDPRAAAGAAMRILEDRDLKEKFSAASRAFARTMNWRRVTDAYRQIYHEITRS